MLSSLSSGYMPMPGSNSNTPYPSYPSAAYPGYNPNAATPGGPIYPSYPTPPNSAGMGGYPTIHYPYQPAAATANPPYPVMPTPSPAPPVSQVSLYSHTNYIQTFYLFKKKKSMSIPCKLLI